MAELRDIARVLLVSPGKKKVEYLLLFLFFILAYF